MVAVGAGLARDGTHHEVRSRARPAPTFSVSSGRSGFAVLNSYTRSLDVVAKGWLLEPTPWHRARCPVHPSSGAPYEWNGAASGAVSAQYRTALIFFNA